MTRAAIEQLAPLSGRRASLPLKDRSSFALFIRLALRTWAGQYPAIFYALYGLRKDNRAKFVRPQSELVIEGFPRSANSFVVAALEHVHARPLNMAHHIHVPAQILRASCMRIPALVLIRNPLDAVTSLLVFTPRIPVASALQAYCSFYATILPYRACFVAATFEAAVEHLDQVVERLNQRFSTGLVVPRLFPKDRDRIFKSIDESNQRAHGNLMQRTGRPSLDREAAKRAVRARVQNSHHEALLKKADEIYRRFVMTTCCITVSNGPDAKAGGLFNIEGNS